MAIFFGTSDCVHDYTLSIHAAMLILFVVYIFSTVV